MIGTIDKYFPRMPICYRPTIDPIEGGEPGDIDDYIVKEILDGLNDNFGSDWDFSRDYVEKTLNDRLIHYISAGWNLAFHMRIFDRDFEGKKCFGVGGVFKTKMGGEDDVRSVFNALRRYASDDVKLGYGMAPEDLCRHYVRNCLGGHYVDYDSKFKLYFVEFNNYRATDDDIRILQKSEMF